MFQLSKFKLIADVGLIPLVAPDPSSLVLLLFFLSLPLRFFTGVVVHYYQGSSTANYFRETSIMGELHVINSWLWMLNSSDNLVTQGAPPIFIIFYTHACLSLYVVISNLIPQKSINLQFLTRKKNVCCL